MNTVHFILTAKGGVGKTYVASLLGQYLDANTLCADTDPSNQTFTSYAAIGAVHYNIMTEDMEINRSRFDHLIEDIFNHDGDCLIDNGSSSFLPMMSYIVANDIFHLLLDAGKKVIVHAILIGGLGIEETTRGLCALLESRAAPVLIWENELYGVGADRKLTQLKGMC